MKLLDALLWFFVATIFCIPRVYSFLMDTNQLPRGLGGKLFCTSTSEEIQSKEMFQSFSTVVEKGEDSLSEIKKMLKGHTIPRDRKVVAFLFISQGLSQDLTTISSMAQNQLGNDAKLMTVVGGGVIGGDQELEGCFGASLIVGALPDDSDIEFFSGSNGDESDYQSLESVSSNEEIRSCLLFADPFYLKLQSVLSRLEQQSKPGVVAGGISVASKGQKSLAIGDRVLPPGSYIGAQFSGNIGIQVITSQGCRPVGPTYTVTSVDGPAIHELDSLSAIDQLETSLKQGTDEDREACSSKGLLGGISICDGTMQVDAEDVNPGDFSLRQVTGFRPRSGSILVCGPQIREGDRFRFHVRSASFALQDWSFVHERAKTERLFVGSGVGSTLGALQISCLTRGQSFFGDEGADLKQTKRLVNQPGKGAFSTPVAGFFANAEIGPVGINLGSKYQDSKSFLLGFATVVLLLCDYSNSPQGDRASEEFKNYEVWE